MQELIAITKTQINGAEVNSVSIKDLVEAVGVLSHPSQWFQRQVKKYGFVENEDYLIIKSEIQTDSGKKYSLDYIVTIDTAKELAMIVNNQHGRNVRKYFIEVEKQVNKPLSFEEMAKQTILLADKKIKELENTIEANKPLVAFASAINGTTSNIDFETFAKALYDAEGIKMGRNTLMKWFRDNGYLMKNNKPYQMMLDRGLMMLKEGSYINQSTQELVTYTQPRITGKGQMYFTNKLLDEAK